MIRVNGFYLYTGGQSLRPLADLTHDTTLVNAQLPLYIARGWLEPVVKNESIFRLKTSWQAGNSLLDAITDAVVEIETAVSVGSEESQTKKLGWMHAYKIKNALTQFETVLGAEWNLADLFLVSPLPGFDTTALIESGTVLFPKDLLSKVPEAAVDANDFGKCLAFNLSNSAGFHLHRLNEAVLRRYYDCVTGKKPRPKQRTIGGYIEALKKHSAGEAKVIAALDSLRELHRNPLMHPEQRLETIDEAIALHGAIYSVVVYMLKGIPKESDSGGVEGKNPSPRP
jgi:hypothetical protein